MEKNSSALTFGNFTFTRDTQRVQISSGTSASLTPGQCAILDGLGAVEGEIVTKEALYQSICMRSKKGTPEPKIVDVQICKLRKVLDGLFPNGGDYIITVWGKGYCLQNAPRARKDAFQGVRGRTTGLLKRLAKVKAS